MKIITALELINNCSMKIITTLELINTSGLHYYGGICNDLPVMEINLYNVFTSQWNTAKVVSKNQNNHRLPRYQSIIIEDRTSGWLKLSILYQCNEFNCISKINIFHLVSSDSLPFSTIFYLLEIFILAIVVMIQRYYVFNRCLGRNRCNICRFRRIVWVWFWQWMGFYILYHRYICHVLFTILIEM